MKIVSFFFQKTKQKTKHFAIKIQQNKAFGYRGFFGKKKESSNEMPDILKSNDSNDMISFGLGFAFKNKQLQPNTHKQLQTNTHTNRAEHRFPYFSNPGENNGTSEISYVAVEAINTKKKTCTFFFHCKSV